MRECGVHRKKKNDRDKAVKSKGCCKVRKKKHTRWLAISTIRDQTRANHWGERGAIPLLELLTVMLSIAVMAGLYLVVDDVSCRTA